MLMQKPEMGHVCSGILLLCSLVILVCATGSGALPTLESEQIASSPSPPPNPLPEPAETKIRDSRHFSATIFRDIAKEITGRLAGNSQILSLNVTNVIILLVLKGILYGAALIGSGALFGGYKSRSQNEIRESGVMGTEGSDEPVISESEVLMLLGYLMGETANKYDCLNKIACQDPKKATEYIHAARMLLKGSSLLYKNDIPQYAKYQRVLNELQRAVGFGNSNGDCEELYSCGNQY